MLRLSPLGGEDMRALLSEYLPGISAGERDGLLALSDGSIGAALGLHAGGGLAMMDALDAAVPELLSGRNAGILGIVDMVGGREESFEVFKLVFSKIADGALRLESGLAPMSGAGKSAARAIAGRAQSPDSLFAFRDALLDGFGLARSLGLDVSASVISAFERLKNL
jgi:hypothetical protein